MMTRLILVLALVSLSAGSWAQQQAPAPASTPAAVQNLQNLADRAALGAGSSSPAAAKAAGNVAFDQENAATASVQAPAPAPSAQPPQAGAAQPPAGITYPSDDGSGDGGGSPADQIGDMIAKALQTPQVTQAIDKVREDQMNKVFNDQRVKGLNKQLTIGAGVFAGGLALGIVGALTANPILAAAGFGVAAGVGLVAALSWLLK